MATDKKRKLDPDSSGGGSSAPSFMGGVPTGNCSFNYILKIAAVDPAFLLRVKDMLGDDDPLIAFRTIFVRGFGWDATVDTLRKAFEPYGRIEDCRVAAVDSSRYAGCGGGVGLVVFETPQIALKALENPHKTINNYPSHIQLPFPGRPLVIFSHPDYTPVFVTNVPQSAAAAVHLEARFREFGQVAYGPSWFQLPLDHAVIIMRTPEDAAKAVEEPKKTIFGCEVQCSITVDIVLETSMKELLKQVEAAYNTYDLDSSSRTCVFVNHLHEELDDDKLKEFFAQFGEIVAGPIPFLPETDCSWRFALFIYKTSVEADTTLLETQGKKFDGHPLRCQASPDDFMKQTVMDELDWCMKRAKYDQHVMAEQFVTWGTKSSNHSSGAVGSSPLGNGEHSQPAPVGNYENPSSWMYTAVQLVPPSSRKMDIPNNKVDVLLGKAGETIKNLQFNSGAKIQITRDTEVDSQSSTRPVELIGTPENIDKAEKLIRDVIAEADAGGSPAFVARGFGTVQSVGEFLEIPVPNDKVPRPSNLSGKYNQQSFCPCPPQWGPHAASPSQQTTGYDYSQRGVQYPPHATQYPQTYGGYPPPPPARSDVGAGWDQRPSVPAQSTNQTGGYGYYGQGTPAAGVQPSNTMPTPAPASVPPAPVNYNYGQLQAQGYGHPPPYAQSAPTQQSYGHVNNEPRHDQAPPSQQSYGQQSGAPPGVYRQQSTAPQTGYAQQQTYGGPVYGAPAQELMQTYGVPRTSQPGDPMYPGQQMHMSYGQAGIPQQLYPYGLSAPLQPAYGQSYGPTSGTGDYTQPSSSTYPQQDQTATGYGQGGPPVPAYVQPRLQPGGYAQQCPQSQPSYGNQSPPSNVNYGYQGGPNDPSYANNAQVSEYGATPMPDGQPGYAQPLPGYYEQSPTQAGQANIPATAPVGYTKSLSPGPQPGYGLH